MNSEETMMILNELSTMNRRFDRIDEHLGGIDERLDKVDERLDKIDERLDKVDERLGKMDERFDKMDERLDKMDERLDKMDERFDKTDERLDKMDEHFEKLDKSVSDIKLTLENETNRNIRLIAESHLTLNRKLDDALKVDNEKELLLIRVNILENEVRKLKERSDVSA